MLREEYLEFFDPIEEEDGATSGQTQDRRRRGRRRGPRKTDPAPPPPVAQPGKYDALLSRLAPAEKGPAVSGGDIPVGHAPNPEGTGSVAARLPQDPRVDPGPLPHESEFIRNKLDATIAQAPDVGYSRQKRSFWDRLGSGIWNAYKNWDGSGGWGKFLGDAITQGGGAAFDPKMDADLRRQRQIQDMFGEYQIRSGLEQADMGRAKTSAEVQKILADIQDKGLETTIRLWKPYIDQRMSARQFTPEDAAILQSAGIPVRADDFRARRPTVVGGVPYSTAETGAPDTIRDPGMPDDPTKYALPYNTPLTGTPVATTGDKILETEGRVLENDAGRAQQTQQFNATQINQARRAHVSDLNTWASQSAQQRLALLQQAAQIPGMTGTVQGATARLQAALGRIQAIAGQMSTLPDGDSNIPQLEAELVKAQEAFAKEEAAVLAEAGKLQGSAQLLQQMSALPPMPQPQQYIPQTVAPVKTEGAYRRGRGKRTFSASDIDRVIRQ